MLFSIVTDPAPLEIPLEENPPPPVFPVIVEFWITKVPSLVIAVARLLLIVLFINESVAQLLTPIQLIPVMEIWRAVTTIEFEQYPPGVN